MSEEVILDPGIMLKNSFRYPCYNVLFFMTIFCSEQMFDKRVKKAKILCFKMIFIQRVSVYFNRLTIEKVQSKQINWSDDDLVNNLKASKRTWIKD